MIQPRWLVRCGSRETLIANIKSIAFYKVPY